MCVIAHSDHSRIGLAHAVTSLALFIAATYTLFSMASRTPSVIVTSSKPSLYIQSRIWGTRASSKLAMVS